VIDVPVPRGMPTKVCRRCGETKPLIAYSGRKNTCATCEAAQRQRTLERKDAISYSDALAERIVDGVASGLTFAEICAPAGMPTVRQLTAWRRRHPELAEAMDAARTHRATIRSDRIDETLASLRAQKISAADARTIIDAEMKLMALEDPARFNPATKVQAEVSGPNGAPLQLAVVDDASLIKAARWVADLLSKADRVPAIDVTLTKDQAA
jgi:ribosomal protein L37E